MPHILFVHLRFPEYDRCSGDLRLTNMLRILSQHHKITLHILYKPAEFLGQPDNKKYIGIMQELGIEVRTGSLRSSLRHKDYDLVLIEFWYLARHLFEDIRALRPNARIAVDTEHVYFYSDQLKAKAFGQDVQSAKLNNNKREELSTYAKADLVITTTEEDKAVLLAENSSLRIATVPNIHQIHAQNDSDFAKRKQNSLIFVGNFSNNPSNIDAMVYFCGQVLPLIRHRFPSISLAIVGNKPPPEVQALACDHVTVTGYVPDVEPYLASSMVSICPLRYGAGLKGKIGEAMMHGLPVVTTSIGTQGMNARIGVDILVGDSPEEFSNCVAKLLQQAELWKALSKNGQDLVIRGYSFETVGERISGIMSELNKIPIKRYGQAKRLAVKSRLDVADFLQRQVLWRIRRSA